MYCIFSSGAFNQCDNRINLSLEDEVGTDLVGGARGDVLVETLSVESETEARLNTRAEGLGVPCPNRVSPNREDLQNVTRTKTEDTSVVDLSLDESGVVKVTTRHVSTPSDVMMGICTYALAPTSRWTFWVVPLVSYEALAPASTSGETRW